LNNLILAVLLLTGSPSADVNKKIEQCWARAHQMQEEGISQSTVESYVTKCIGETMRRIPVEPKYKPEREWTASN
jgi:hypothetical protein